MLKQVIILTILVVFNCLNSWSTNKQDNIPIGNLIKTDTTKVIITIDEVRKANAKFIERLYLIQINHEKDSIILLKNNLIDRQQLVIIDFQNRLSKANDINKDIKKDLDKQKNKTKLYKSISIGAIIVAILSLIAK